LHAALLLVAATAPRSRTTQAEQIQAMRPYLVALEARSRAEGSVITDLEGEGEGRVVNDEEGDGVAGGGERHAQPEGKAGSTLSHERERRRWSQRRREPEKSGDWDGKSTSAAQFGLVGLLGHRGSTAMFGPGDRALVSNDPIAASGAMWSRPLGESPGADGVGLSGTGIGGGGTGLGVGLDHVGDLGHTVGPPGPGTGGKGSAARGSTFVLVDGWGGAWDSGGGGYGFGQGDRWYNGSCGDSLSGRLPPESIQRIVRQNFGRFRLCYERGLARNPALTGRVATRFRIDREGKVAEAADQGSDLPDPDVVACVTRAFTTLAFPKPEDATVTVVYPIQFIPD
jgi:hypothetical protein